MKRMSQDVDSSSFPERGSFFLFRGRLGACRRASADGPSGVAHLLTALRPPPSPLPVSPRPPAQPSVIVTSMAIYKYLKKI